MSITVRPTRIDDGPALFRAWHAMREHNASMDSRIQLIPITEREFTLALKERLAEPITADFVAEEDGRIVGFVSGGLEAGQLDRLPERHATIGYLYVDPEARRKGVGEKLFKAMTEWASQQEGVSHMEMTVLAGNSDAADFWRSLGFTPFIERLWSPLPGKAAK